MGEWQPIESAPKDGTEVLGFRDDCGVLLMRWCALADFLTDSELADLDEETSFAQDWFYADFVAGGRLEGGEAPTHWQPLPDPPGTETGIPVLKTTPGGNLDTSMLVDRDDTDDVLGGKE